jgi:hypothetical protein
MNEQAKILHSPTWAHHSIDKVDNADSMRTSTREYVWVKATLTMVLREWFAL